LIAQFLTPFPPLTDLCRELGNDTYFFLFLSQNPLPALLFPPLFFTKNFSSFKIRVKPSPFSSLQLLLHFPTPFLPLNGHHKESMYFTPAFFPSVLFLGAPIVWVKERSSTPPGIDHPSLPPFSSDKSFCEVRKGPSIPLVFVLIRWNRKRAPSNLPLIIRDQSTPSFFLFPPVRTGGVLCDVLMMAGLRGHSLHPLLPKLPPSLPLRLLSFPFRPPLLPATKKEGEFTRYYLSPG